MAKEKQEFSWDTQVRIGGYGDAKERHEVFLCTLNGKTYIQDVKEVHTVKNGWKRVKGNTMPLENFKELQHILAVHESDDALAGISTKQGNKTIIQAPGASLKAKHQAKDSAPALKGKKSSVREKLEKNANFGSLPKGKQCELIAQAEKAHNEDGMVSIAVSKTNFTMVAGKGQIEAEKSLKTVKGFSRAEITFIA